MAEALQDNKRMGKGILNVKTAVAEAPQDNKRMGKGILNVKRL